jgi:hypothetical protein
MTISDIITLISLIIAIVAILSEKNRKHLLLKFHIVDYLLFMTSFIFINYFVFYENFYLRGLYLHCLYFPKFGLKNPKYYAYIITLISLVYLCYKILYAFYPYSKIEKVRKFYRQLIENNEIPFLLDLIDRYHKSDIIKFIDRTSDNIPNDNYRANFYHKETFIEKLKKNCENVIQYLLPYSWFNRKIYGVYVLYNVLNDPAFISTASDKRPYFFADIFSHFKKEKRDGFPEELINSYLKELIENKNFWLKKELQESQKNDSGQPEYFYNENKIISALLQDLSVAEVNKIWQPFGNIAINEIEQERIIGYESKMFKDFIEEQSLWEYKTYFSIQFFKILIIETLVKKT